MSLMLERKFKQNSIVYFICMIVNVICAILNLMVGSWFCIFNIFAILFIIWIWRLDFKVRRLM
jgi:hypothetical protein